MAKTIEQILAKAEKDLLAVNEEQGVKHLELKAKADSLNEELVQAQALPERIRSDWDKGEERPALHMVEAEANIERLNALSRGARLRANAVLGQLNSTDVDVAEALIPSVQAALPGVPVIATYARKCEEIPTSLYPVAIIVQTTPSKRNEDDDSVSGKAELRYHRSSAHRPVDLRKIADTAASICGQVKVPNFQAQEPKRDFFVDVHRLEGFGIRPHREMTIAEIDPEAAKNFERAVGTSFAAILQEGRTVIGGSANGSPYKEQANGAWEYISGRLIVNGDASPEIEEDIDDGIRTVRVTSRLSIRGAVQGDMAYAMSSAAIQQRGRTIGGLGYCQEASAMPGGRSRNGQSFFTVSATYVSRTV